MSLSPSSEDLNMDLQTVKRRMVQGLPVTCDHNTYEAARKSLDADPRAAAVRRAIKLIEQDYGAYLGDPL
jgi:hypothetical protein